MSYSKRKLSELLNTICAHSHLGFVPSLAPRRTRVVGGDGSRVEVASPTAAVGGTVTDSGGPSVTVIDEGCDAFDSFVEELLRDEEMRARVGREAIEQQTQDLLRTLGGSIPDDADVEAIIKNGVLKPLRAAITPWLVAVPIDNFELDLPLRIGSVELIATDGGPPIAEMFTRLGRSDLSSRKNPLMMAHLGDFTFRCWAAVEVQAHAKHYPHVAYERVEMAVSALRAFTNVLFPRTMRCRFGPAGFLPRGKSLALAANATGTLSFHSGVTGALSAFRLNADVLCELRANLPFDRLCELMGGGGVRSELEETVARSCLWLSRATVAASSDDELVGIAIALERMLNCGQDASVDRISYRLALLISSDLDRRLEIQRSIKRLYDVRSNIVHDGFIGATVVEVGALYQLAVDALIQMIRLSYELQTHEQLRDWFNRKLLA